MADALASDPPGLEDLHARVRACTLCPLHEGRTHAVPGEGSVRSGLMVVGEAPGRNEDESGRPFCGAAGKNLDLALDAAGIAREEVFVTSIVKCRPPKNRDPRPAERAACRPYLEAQVGTLRPRVLVALGRHGLHGLLPEAPEAKRPFGEVRGRFLEGPGGIPVFCSLHPAAILYRRAWREQYLEDWRRLGAWLRGGDVAGFPQAP